MRGLFCSGREPLRRHSPFDPVTNVLDSLADRIPNFCPARGREEHARPNTDSYPGCEAEKVAKRVIGRRINCIPRVLDCALGLLGNVGSTIRCPVYLFRSLIHDVNRRFQKRLNESVQFHVIDPFDTGRTARIKCPRGGDWFLTWYQGSEEGTAILEFIN